MSDHSIWLLEYGYIDGFPASNLFHARPFEGFRRMPYCFGLVRSADRCILIDTGFWDEGRHEKLNAKYGTTFWQPPAEILRRAGVEPKEVDTIVLTHNDFDHAGSVADFPNAHVVIQRREIDCFLEARALPARFGFLTLVSQPDLPETLDALATEGRATLASGAFDLADGIRLEPAFDTHTAGSQFVVIENDSDGRWIFAGDNIYVYENVEGLNGDGVMVPIAMSTGSPTLWLTTMAGVVDSLGGDTRRLLPFHDSQVWERFDSLEFDDGLHIAEISLGGGHPSQAISSDRLTRGDMLATPRKGGRS